MAVKTLDSFRNIHQGADLIVCGCGESLNDLNGPERFITIGVNDVGRKFQPNYLVVINPRQQFANDRFHYVETSRAEAIFTQLDLRLSHANVVRFRLGVFGGTDFSDPNVLHYTHNSPYVALCLARHMGAARIGLIGVDFTANHFFAATGNHPLAPQFAAIDAQYRALGEALRARGVEVVNLSRSSRLTAFPKMSIEEFAARSQPARVNGRKEPLRIVSYATTPVAGVPAILARCIRTHTEHDCRCVWAQSGYANGVAFEGDIQWMQSPEEARSALARADAVIVHNGKVAPEHGSLLAGKAVVTMAHNYKWNVDTKLVEQGFPGVVVGQYQATLAEFDGWTAVPNPVPLQEEAFRPAPKGRTITLCYTPFGRHERYPREHKLYWHAKGNETTMRILDRLAARCPLQLEVLRDRQVAHAEALAMKRRAHIVIDECVTGSYHRNSLEGLAAGCVVVNGIGILPGVADVLRRCAGDAETIPFVPATLEMLEAVLAGLIARGADALAEEGARNRAWMERHWNFTDQWTRFWAPILDQALDRAGGRANARRPVAPPMNRTLSQRPAGVPAQQYRANETPDRAADLHAGSVRMPGQPLPEHDRAGNAANRPGRPHAGLSVVVPHGGAERAALLLATLRNLRQCAAVAEVIVVEMAEAPEARNLAEEWADRYTFLRKEDLFHKARVLNTGSALATGELILWLDNDLLFASAFLDRAIAEFHARQLDCLIPWTSVGYLTERDTAALLQGARRPEGCTPVNTYYSRQGTCGAAVLVRRAFTEQYGGLCEEFRGWGGEDNAWFVKARLLGRAAVTARNDQHLYHLYHLLSGGYGSRDHIAGNPHYARNVELLYAMRAIRDPAEFLRRFPPAKPVRNGNQAMPATNAAHRGTGAEPTQAAAVIRRKEAESDVDNQSVYLDTLTPAQVSVGHGELGRRGSLGYEGKRVIVRGLGYRRALSAHAPSCIAFELNGRYAALHCRVALNGDVPFRRSYADFAVYADDALIAEAKHVAAGDAPRLLTADLANVQRLELRVATQRWDHCHAVWLDPILSCAGDEAPPAIAAPLRDCLGRLEVVVPPRRPQSTRCIATIVTPGFEPLLANMLGSLHANGQVRDALPVIFAVDPSDACRQIAARYGAELLTAQPCATINATVKSALYSVARFVDAEYFVCLDCDMLILGDLNPLFRALDACVAGTVLACREANGRGCRDIGHAVSFIYGGGEADIARITGADSVDGAYSLVVNDGLFAGGRAAMLALDEQIRSWPEAPGWVDEREDIWWRNQFVFNLALAYRHCGVELDEVYNIQLNSQDVTVNQSEQNATALWHDRPVRGLHFNGSGRGKYPQLQGLFVR